jgi:prepilin-type N-terminal cleavage/methylation domain-containing protein
MRSRLNRGFTLVELLVVIAVIAVVAALLLPTVAGVRESAFRASCASGLRQVGMSLLAYASDFDGHLPGVGLSYQRLQDWTNDVREVTVNGVRRYDVQMGGIIYALDRDLNSGTIIHGPELNGLSANDKDRLTRHREIIMCPRRKVNASRYDERTFNPGNTYWYRNGFSSYSYFSGSGRVTQGGGNLPIAYFVKVSTLPSTQALVADTIVWPETTTTGAANHSHTQQTTHWRMHPYLNTVEPAGGNVVYVNGSVQWVQFRAKNMTEGFLWTSTANEHHPTLMKPSGTNVLSPHYSSPFTANGQSFFWQGQSPIRGTLGKTVQ